MKPKLSIIIPNYNEHANIEAGVIEEVNQYLKKVKFTYEVIISDDGSTDGSLKLIEQKSRLYRNFRTINNVHGGKAAAILSGIKAAKGEIILFTDMDQSTPLKEI
jgi:glycosyltransferase involved in cell wall biosynthesis